MLSLHPHSLVHKLAIKPDMPYRQWLLAELEQRFDYPCCDNNAEFRREKLALSRRFAVIDEALGRGSDDLARYGLELFRRMNLQLLIVTPLQKIHVIEPYVTGLGFVHGDRGRQSMLRYLSFGEYQAECAARCRSRKFERPAPKG
jgi:uncharacterized protein YPO0396